jgi:hypothetical protein
MRRIIAITAIGFWLTGCSGQQPPSQLAQTKPVDIGDESFIETGKKFHEAFAKGDVEEWLRNFTDDALFARSGGDTLMGKVSIYKYWKNHWSQIDSFSFSETLWLPIAVNQPQPGTLPGNWALAWYRFEATLENGTKVMQWGHDAIHFNSNRKIDRFFQYVDLLPINKAMEQKDKK